MRIGEMALTSKDNSSEICGKPMEKLTHFLH